MDWAALLWFWLGVAAGLSISAFFRGARTGSRGVIRPGRADPMRPAYGYARVPDTVLPQAVRIRLAHDVDCCATTLTVAPKSAGDRFPDAGQLRIGLELMNYGTKQGDVFTGLERGAMASRRLAHEAGDVVHLVGVAVDDDPQPIQAADLPAFLKKQAD